MDISSRDFEAHPNLFLRRAEAGETIVVTDQGRAIAELRPAQPAGKEEAALLGLARAGILTPPQHSRRKQSASLKLTGPSMAQTILEDRKDRF